MFKLLFATFLFANTVVAAPPRPDGSLRPNSDFAEIVGYETLEAEQLLVDRMPLGSDVYKFMELFLSSWSLNGDLPQKYSPAEAQTIEIVSVLIPEAKIHRYYAVESILNSPDQSQLRVQQDGQFFYRAFFHPHTIQKQNLDLSPYQKDPIEWIGTPTSSARSLFIKPLNAPGPVFIGKLSLDVVNGSGYNRILKDANIDRAVQVSGLFQKIWNTTNGQIPHTNKVWSFLAEDEAIYPIDNAQGGFILRSLQKDYNKTIKLPWFALLANPIHNGRWFGV